ncbi:MAG: MMPL family transporter [Planctomycetales bacterium]|nr:MMPL family transporter [Planctomycetales bacterium]
MDALFSIFARWSLRNRFVVVVLLSLISGGAVVGVTNPELITRWLLPADGRAETEESVAQFADPPPNIRPLSFAGADAIVVVESQDFFTAANVHALRQVVRDLEALPQVQSVIWMDRMPILNIFGLPEPLLPTGHASPQRYQAARDKAQANPLVYGQLLSDDMRSTLLLIHFDGYQLFSDEQATSEIKATAVKSAEAAGNSDLTFRVTGHMPMWIAHINSHEANQLKFQLIGYGMILLMTLVLFRGLRAVIIVSLGPIVGVLWTLGYIGYFDVGGNPLVAVILPILVSLVGLTDGVHLMVEIRKLRASGLEHQQAALQGLTKVGMACFLTSLTTATGLGSLMLAKSELVREFGMCSMIGVLLSFISVITVIPLACSTWLGARVHIGHDRSLVDINLARIGIVIQHVLRHPGQISVLGIACTLALIGVSLTLQPDQRESDGLPASAEATLAMQHVDRAFGGLQYSQVRVSWDQAIAADSPLVLKVLIDVDDLLKQEPLIGHPLSIRNLLDAQPGSGQPEERMSLLELLPPPLKRAFYTPEHHEAWISFRVMDLGIATYGPVFTRIEKGLAKIQDSYAGFHLELAGNAIWRWRNLYQIVVDLASSLGTASLIILITLSIVYRSIRLGLISIVPNLFPLAFTGGYLVWAGYNLEIVMVCSFTICLGIAVDDTIHFLTRYREELTRTQNKDIAIERAFTGVGTALIMTTLVLVAGFSTVIASDSRDHRIFATMGVLTISAALFCDLVFLPAMLSYFDQPKVADEKQADVPSTPRPSTPRPSTLRP